MHLPANTKRNEGDDPIGSAEIQRQIQSLAGRDLQIWSISILVILVLASGFLTMVFPNVAWRPGMHVETRYLPQFFFGFITLIVLFNIYIVSQKRTIIATRRELIRELIFSERMESASMVDPATQLLNRLSMDTILSREVSRANRLGTSLTLLVLKVDSLKTVKAKYGASAGDQFFVETAKLVRNTLRGSDTVLRYGDEEFLAVLPETNETEADYALRRLLTAVDHWNLTTKTGWEISFSYGLAAHTPGVEIRESVRAAMRKMLQGGQKLVPVVMEIPAPASTVPQRVTQSQ